MAEPDLSRGGAQPPRAGDTQQYGAGSFGTRGKIAVDSADVRAAKADVAALHKEFAGLLGTLKSLTAEFKKLGSAMPSTGKPATGGGGGGNGAGAGISNGGRGAGAGGGGGAVSSEGAIGGSKYYKTKMGLAAGLFGAEQLGSFWERRLPENIAVDTVGQRLSYGANGGISNLQATNAAMAASPFTSSRADMAQTAAQFTTMTGVASNGQLSAGMRTGLASASSLSVINPGMSQAEGGAMYGRLQSVKQTPMGWRVGQRIAVRGRSATAVFQDVRMQLRSKGVAIDLAAKEGVQPGGRIDMWLDQYFGEDQEQKDSFIQWLRSQQTFESKGNSGTFDPAKGANSPDYLKAGGVDTNSVYYKDLTTSTKRANREQVTFATKYGDISMQIELHDKANAAANAAAQATPFGPQMGPLASGFMQVEGILNSIGILRLLGIGRGAGGGMAGKLNLFKRAKPAGAAGVPGVSGGAGGLSGLGGGLSTAEMGVNAAGETVPLATLPAPPAGAAAGGAGLGAGGTAAIAIPVIISIIAALGLKDAMEEAKAHKAAGVETRKDKLVSWATIQSGQEGSADAAGSANFKGSIVKSMNPFLGAAVDSSNPDSIWSRAKSGWDNFWGGTGDPMQDQLQGISPQLRPKLAAMMKDNPNLFVNSGYRTFAKQSALQAQGFPVATGGSLHTSGRAADMGGDMSWLMENASKYGLWHPDPNEPWHVEGLDTKTLRGGYSMLGALNLGTATSGFQPGLLPAALLASLTGGGSSASSSAGGTGTTTGGEGSGASGPVDPNDPQIIDKLLHAIRTTESGGDYKSHTRAYGASGAYQFVPTTWNNYKGYAEAYMAPPEIQDEKAREMATNAWNQYHDPRKVAQYWFWPAEVGNDNFVVPGNGGITLGQYAERWMKNFGPVGDPGMTGGGGGGLNVNHAGNHFTINLGGIHVAQASMAEAERFADMVMGKIQERAGTLELRGAP